MGYMKIFNLYKEQDILLMKECFALEKIHGTSCNVSYDGKSVKFFSGGENHERFVKLFDEVKLTQLFRDKFGDIKVVIYGEGYGGSQQSMSATYGKDLKFIVFDVQVGDCWLAVPQAEDVVKALGLEFVHYVKIPTTLEAIDEQRDTPSVQAVRNGILDPKIREGVVLRPIMEFTKNNGSRLICKHKRKEFSENIHTPKVVDPAKLEVLTNAQAIADNWVTEMRLIHVLDKLPDATGIEHTGKVIKAMVEDVLREGEGEFVVTKEVTTAISRKAAELWKAKVTQIL